MTMSVGGLLTRGGDNYVCGWSVDKGEKMIMSVGGLLTRGRR